MLYKSNVPVTIEINTVQDLSKPETFMEHNNLKLNKSEIARKLNINRRTVYKYLKGFQNTKHRNKPSRPDDYTDIISGLLSSDTQVFSFSRCRLSLNKSRKVLIHLLSMLICFRIQECITHRHQFCPGIYKYEF